MWWGESWMLGNEPSPYLDETFSYVRSEEDCTTLMMKPISQESLALKIVQVTANFVATCQAN